MKRVILVISAVILFITFFTSSLMADRGHYSFNPNISIYQEGQKAICAWNGKEEIMILATDLKASGKTRVLEFLPLPSKPTRVEKSSNAPFEEIQRLIKSNSPPAPESFRMKGKIESGTDSVEVVFHEKIGAHDITIVRVYDIADFMNWIYKFLQKEAVEYSPAWGERARPLLEDLLHKGLKYYVFDIIDLTPDRQTIEPIMYKFSSSALYFPLKVSSLDKGRVEIGLFLFTPGKPDIHGTMTGFDCGHYLMPGTKPVPIKFKVRKTDLNRVSEDIGKLFSTGGAWFSTAVFRGPVNMLKRDFYIK
ncbi:MAG: DUF2330 domain-containing protein [Candidatus Eremiobacteraeota bacterium]|nr:DUF2330 domain-containing protein [Candidatus Eremiobacteraeota bacterium]